MTFAEFQMQNYGYEVITKFWDDFSTAEKNGLEAIQDAFDKVFKWKDNFKCLAELVLVLNHKRWMHSRMGSAELSKIYFTLWHQANDYALDNLKGLELSRYLDIMDLQQRKTVSYTELA